MSRGFLGALLLVACGSGAVASRDAGSPDGGGAANANTGGGQAGGGGGTTSSRGGHGGGGGTAGTSITAGAGGLKSPGDAGAGSGGKPAAGTAGFESGGSSAGAIHAGAGGSGAVAGTGGSGAAFTYHTDFSSSESPLSEGGIWHNGGLDWTNVVTSGGLAFGTQAGHTGAPYDDSYAILSGWPPDHYAEAVIHLESGITAQYEEVEILLRWSDSPHYSIGYECNLAFNGQYCTIGRWPGPLGTGDNGGQAFDFQPSPIGVQDGDIFSAQIIGYTITSWLTRAGVRHQLCTATDTSAEKLSTGSPGIGFYTAGAPANNKFSLTSFSAHSL